jgi:predicted 3-demethylubiquinone-9 3-methyltransferase (glyoxalase superfamily)
MGTAAFICQTFHHIMHVSKESPMKSIVPSLWFDTQAEEAAQFYTTLFPESAITNISYYAEAGQKPAGTVLAVSFHLRGQPFLAINGGPEFHFTEAVSFQIECESQAEVDQYWQALSAGGEEGPCGWLKDRYGLSWQVTPIALSQMMSDPDPAKVTRVTAAMMQMQKIDLAELQRAYDGA